MKLFMRKGCRYRCPYQKEKQNFAFKGENRQGMVKYYCDLCDKEVNKYNEYTLPIAATWINGEPCEIGRAHV